ncbi:unnamed protein product, partial [Rotaria magnacalcarata]
MAAKFAQRRKVIDENVKPDSSHANNNNKASSKLTAATLPPTTAAPVQTSPRSGRKTNESGSTNYTSADLEKFKIEILAE